ncbi:unnamed protein product [Schistosoma mattheei]|uniref:Uncharacterized protein n=1 Tax=Schistosoma mattheei TaxID=31246 RepID=A0A3P8GX14_9TREM|nr:unnamed protein product [Schistosoma mattheei]
MDPFGMNDPSGMCRRYEYSDEEDDEDTEYTAASGRSSSQPTKGAAIAPPSVLLEDVTVTPGSNASQNSESSVNDDDPGVSTASSKFGMYVFINLSCSYLVQFIILDFTHLSLRYFNVCIPCVYFTA